MSGNLAFVVVCVGAVIVVFIPAYLLDRRRRRKAVAEGTDPPPFFGQGVWTTRLMREGALPPERIVENYANLPDAIRGWGTTILVLGTGTTVLVVWGMLTSEDVPLGLPISLVPVFVGLLAILCPEPVMYGVLAFTYTLQVIPSLAPGTRSLCSAGNLISAGIALVMFFLFRVAVGFKKLYEALPDNLQVIEMTNHAEDIFPALGALLGGAAVLTRLFLWLVAAIAFVSAPAVRVEPFVASFSVMLGIAGFAISLSSLMVGFKRAGLSIIGVLSSGALLLFWLMLVFGITV
jgi:hypothetical protein